MKTFVLAGGLGTRLRPRFGDRPKALAPVAGRPWIDRQLEWLAVRGLRNVVLCIGHGGDEVESHVDDGSRFGVRVDYAREREPLGTGGALRQSADPLEEPALVMNGDTLAECNPWELLRFAWERGGLGALALFRVPDARAVGRVECDGDGRVLRFVEKDATHAGEAWVSGGLYVLMPEAWQRLPQGGPSSLEHELFPWLAAEGRLWGLREEGRFYDIGTPESWAEADRHFARA